MSYKYLRHLYYAFPIFCVFICIIAQNYLSSWYEDILRLLFTSNYIAASFPVASSLWCHPDTDGHKLCSFKNLCYAPLEKQFIFILADNSHLSGVSSKRDLKSLELSSVSHHNNFILKLALVSEDNKVLKRRIINEKSAFIITRFKPDNIMHVIHDDLLPLYVTYSNICLGDVLKCTLNYQLVFTDYEDVNSSFSEWYRLFSKSKPYSLDSGDVNSIVCFEEARTGLLRSSVWFEYGFGTKQGPVSNTELNGNVITQFSNFVLHNLNIKPMFNTNNSAVSVVFSRKLSRRILNEDHLVKSMIDTYSLVHPDGIQLKPLVLDMSVNNTKIILSALSQSKLVVGMHGAEMILGIFLPNTSVIVEMFPFGIDPKNVSPMKSLSSIKGIGFVYKSWVNMNENNTLTHPEAPALLGGIRHLPLINQSEIMKTISVPAVQCCHDPAYLYRMFQDTLVGTDFVKTFEEALEMQKRFSDDVNERTQMFDWWFPSPVNKITCDFTCPTLTLRWNSSLNIEGNTALYEVTVTCNDLHLEFVVAETQLIISSLPTILRGSYFNIWVKCIVPEFDAESLDSYLECIAP